MNRIQIETREVNLYYGQSRVLRDVTPDIPEKAVTALIGPSGCEKQLPEVSQQDERLHPLSQGEHPTDGFKIYEQQPDDPLRAHVLAFQKPNPFPMSIYDNVAYGPRLHGIRDRAKVSMRSFGTASPGPHSGTR